MAEEGRLLDEQLEAAERELSQSKQATRALRHRVKQRQISRRRKRTMKHELRNFVREPEQEVEEFERALACVEDFHSCQGDWYHSDPWELWREWEQAFNLLFPYHDFLQEFEPSLNHRLTLSCMEDAAQKTLRDLFHISFGDSCLCNRWDLWRDIDYKEFLTAAQRLIDPATMRRPAMKLLRVQPEDPRYHSVVTLYATYKLFHSMVVRKLSSRGWPSRPAVRALAAWRPKHWTQRRHEALVRVQALWRGWHLRHRVLYSPHTELGRRFLLQSWHRDLGAVSHIK
ncbi:hypothetical protein COCOBI_08-5550 [Coccomyxa sp. Obi]|nr:hypothetical protein COCOBI_08-5550 [Coccomyxa sp. Obi]